MTYLLSMESLLARFPLQSRCPRERPLRRPARDCRLRYGRGLSVFVTERRFRSVAVLRAQQRDHLVHDDAMLERERSVDRDDGDARPVELQQTGIARDVHLLQVERLLAASAGEPLLRDVAEVASGLRVQDDAAHGSGRIAVLPFAPPM